MSTILICDGCGEPLAVPAEVGHIIKRQYCEQCAEIAEKFLAEEEALRKAAHEKFIDDRAALIARFSADGGKLPDVP